MEQRTPSPTRRGTLAAPDTVPRPKHVSGSEFRSGDLGKGRTAVLQDLQHIPVVSFEYFKEAILPELPNINIAAIRNSLIESSLWSEADGWAHFHPQQSEDFVPKQNPRPEPSKDSRPEEDIFEGLLRIFDGVIKAARQVAPQLLPTLDLVVKPSKSPSSRRNNSSRPDAYLLMNQRKSTPVDPTGGQDSWDDIAVSFEFKKGSSDADHIDNQQKILWNLHNVMREDPCRRSTFGVTIENTEVRLWFTCRAAMDVDDLTYLFCSLAFANDVELGWDPTIRRVVVDNEIQYDITFDGKDGPPSVYRTVKILADFGADALKGRGTRVFKAYDIQRSPPTEGDYVVIKDSWRDHDRLREDQIIEKVFEDIAKCNPDDPGAVIEAKKYFLTVLRAEDIMIDDKIDNTLRLFHDIDMPPDCPRHKVSPEKEPSLRLHVSSTGHVPLVPLQEEILACQNIPTVKVGDIYHKIHFRVVFAELGEPIFNLETLGDVLETLEHALKGLQLMHGAGWVHRDISAGNVLRCGRQGKIVDLEYAKALNSSGENHDVRTGTPHFMACEVEAQEYLFFQPERTYNLGRPVVADRPPFRFNTLHDLESWWWILTWVLHYFVDGVSQILPPDHDTTYQKCFPGLTLAPGTTRVHVLLTMVRKEPLPTPFHSTAEWVEDMRAALVECYRAAEKSSVVGIDTKGKKRGGGCDT
ncbi:hypothetical protein OG21DRAFT_1520545 [Imleria badia]|nr:hypothetical protein OG21DRAFT_1520545 [Imleria badia]